MIVSRKCSFDAAHFLPRYKGKCKNVHGHRWTVELAVEGPVDPNTGFVVDFSHIKAWLQENVVDEFDHTLINDKIENPTAENIAEWIGKQFIIENSKVGLAYVRVWETPDSMVEWRPEK